MRVFRIACLVGATVCLVVAVALTVLSVTNRGTRSQMVAGRALVRSTQVSSDQCSYRCCDTDDHCRTCYEPCWNGVAIVDVLASDDANVTALAGYMLSTVRSYVSYANAYNYNAQYFPVGSRHDCFYRMAPPLVLWTLPDETGPFIAGMVFFGLAGGALLLWAAGEGLHYARHSGYSRF